MTDDDADTGDVEATDRLNELNRRLTDLAAANERPEPGPHRGVVSLGDALDALQCVGRLITNAAEDGEIRESTADVGISVLMLVREYLSPLPATPGPDGADQVRADLLRKVTDLRESIAQNAG